MRDVALNIKQTTIHPAASGVGSLSVEEHSQQDIYLESLDNLPIQRKLSIGAIDDPLEAEADDMADRVMRMPEQSFIQRKNARVEDEEKLQRKIEVAEFPPQAKHIDKTSFIQRKCTECEKEHEETALRKSLSGTITPFIQTKSDAASSVSDSLRSQIQSSGSGSSLDRNTQTFMDSRFGDDFSSVKIHSDSESIQMNKELNAQAFTVGSDVYFNDGKYQPNAKEGKHLLAHELTHVVQQGEGGLFRKKVATEDFDEVLETPKETSLSAENPEIIEQFRLANVGLSKENLKKWIEICVKNGWQIGSTIPDYHKPIIGFNDKDEPVIEAMDFRGQHGAFNTAAQILPKDVGAKFWWKQRFTEHLLQYKLDYASNKAYENLKLHEKNKDVDFEALRIISEDLSSYREVMQIKAYSDKLLSEALVRLIARAQARLYPDNLNKQTGILDLQTQSDLKLRISARNIANEQSQQTNPQVTKEYGKDAVVLQGPIHDVLRIRIKEIKEAIKAPTPALVKAADTIDSLPFSPIPDLPAEFLYRIGQHLILGFYQHLETITEEEIYKKYYHLLEVQYTPGFIWGQLKGVPQGIWNWIKDMAELIWDLIKLPYTVNRYMVNGLPEDILAAYKAAQQATVWFESNKEVVYKFAKDMIISPENNLGSLSDTIKEQIYASAVGMGSSMAAQISEFADKSNEEIGESIGKIQGYILPDILLAVFSEGIGTAIKGTFQSVKTFMQAGRVGVVTLEIVKTGRAAIASIEKFLEGAKIFAKKAYAEVKTMLISIIEYLKKILGIEEKALETTKVVSNIAEEGKAISKLESKADDVFRREAQKHADEVIENGPEKQSKAKVLGKAIVIAEIADMQNLSILAAIAELDLLKVLNPKVSFESEGHDPYRIWMMGSKYLVDGHYTSKGSGLPNPLTGEKVKAATNLPKISQNSKEWQEAIKIISEGKGKGLNFKVENQREAKSLLEEAEKNFTKRRSYWHDEMKEKGFIPGNNSIVNEGFEYHLESELKGTEGVNDLKHIKWYDYRTGTRTEGHIFFEKWN